jgi:hypothetical protein
VGKGFAVVVSVSTTFFSPGWPEQGESGRGDPRSWRKSLRMDPPGPTTTGLCRDMIGRESGAHTITRACLDMSLIFVATATWRHRSATRGTLNGPRR